MKSLIHKQNGSVLMVAVILVVAILIISVATREVSNLSVNKSGAEIKNKNIQEMVRGTVYRIMHDLKTEAQSASTVLVNQDTLNTIMQNNTIETQDNLGRDCQINNFFFTQIDASTTTDDPTNNSSYIPRNGYFPAEWANLIAEKKRYHFLVKANCKSEKKMAEAYVSLYNVPLFQFLNLSHFPMEYTPGGQYQAIGRLHSNAGFRVGGAGPVVFEPEDLANNKLLALSTAGKLWSLWKIEIGSWTHTYNHTAKVLIDDLGDVALFSENVLGDDSMDYNSCIDEAMGNDPANHCLKGYNPVNNLTTYNREIETSNPEFQGRVATQTKEILPSWYQDLQELADEGILPHENFAHAVIEMGKSDDPEALKKHKKWYQSQLRIVDGKSVDIDGNEITNCALNHLCTSNVVYNESTNSNGFVKRVEGDLYIPITGRKADVNYLDLQKLNQKIDEDSRFGNINHIFIGGSQKPSGEIQFPGPGCVGRINSITKCIEEGGSDCTSSCDIANLGRQDIVLIHNASEIPDEAGGLQITTPNMAFLAGQTNTVGTTPTPFQINSDTMTHISNKFIEENKDGNGWDFDGTEMTQYSTISDPLPDDYSGPIDGPTGGDWTLQKFVTMTGFETPLIESWNAQLYRKMSFVQFWRPKEFPPPHTWDSNGDPIYAEAGDAHGQEVDWHRLAWSFYYTPASWKNRQWHKDWGFVDNSDIAIFLTGIQIDYEIDENTYESKLALVGLSGSPSDPDNPDDPDDPGTGGSTTDPKDTEPDNPSGYY